MVMNIGKSSPRSIYLDQSTECLEPNGRFADPDDVYSYFECIQGTVVKRDCPKGQKWKRTEKMCHHDQPLASE